MRTIQLILAMILCNQSFSQNLVPNPSFESYGTLPCYWIQNQTEFSNSVNDWTMPTWGSSDILSTLVSSSCGLNAFSTHYYAVGGQLPRTGNVMAGIITFNSYVNPIGNPYAADGYREYLEVQLSSPLVIGETYYVEFWVSRAEKLFFACNNIGAYFSDTLINQPIINNIANFGVLSFNPQVNESTIVFDSVGWQKISGCFQATTAAEYMLIGNFFSDQNTDRAVMNPFDSTNCCLDHWRNAYYFIDDVSVSLYTGICNTSTHVESNDRLIDKTELYPNPTSNQLTIDTELNISEVNILDIAGNTIMTVKGNNKTITVAALPNGIYYIKLTADKRVITKKFVKQ